jgi:hypothetical protein
VIVIKPILHFVHGVHSGIDVRVACEHEECRIREVALRWRRRRTDLYIGSFFTFGLYNIMNACMGRYDGVDGIIGVWRKEGQGEECELCVSELLAITPLHGACVQARTAAKTTMRTGREILFVSRVEMGE